MRNLEGIIDPDYIEPVRRAQASLNVISASETVDIIADEYPNLTNSEVTGIVKAADMLNSMSLKAAKMRAPNG